ncbi:Pimeloyl-ACP methyl ester carboxylesterase [Micromonospora phaseoli]|uniref:Pimeloyl-ACP methyl ester carboxylesterase n=1 Tax=Micromonospora phaseoli TaxID=1144548 RepID=A0A1H6X0A1_9ACTN|nr:alpha/beta hydrolase [Micromonospora phaseoli]PZW02026.1 pimeloyl-ACP methyl ester carboxylesterase [Micromonospora phaseoli]GIJ80134.1 lipase [Micromonospora phaseoli]SEJ22468.1 Pimeloyl-ACP methyl ester carboxylesterase [Micromonospora phaseoli]
MTGLRIPRPRTTVGKAAGLVGAVFGVAAAGLAAGVATERALVRRFKDDPADPYADEVFGEQRSDAAYRLEMPDGTDIHVEVVEPTRPVADNPTVVLVHGFCLDMGTFHFQRKMLAQRGEHRIVAYDQPGHGRSGRLESGEYDLVALGHTLRRVIDEVAPDGPLVLVGHSMGGMTIMSLAELFPEMFGDRVVGTVLMATSGGMLAETKLVAPALLGRVGAPVLYMAGNVTRYGGPVIDRARRSTSNVAWLLTRRYGFGTAKPSPALVSYVEQMNSRTSADTVTRYLRTLATHSRFPALAALEGTPVLVIVGDKDMITPLIHSEEIVRRLPHAEFVQIQDSGHVVMLEHADEVNVALSRFLDTCERDES